MSILLFIHDQVDSIWLFGFCDLSEETSGTTATFVVVDGWTVTAADVGDSICILDSQGGVVSLLIVDHRLEENAEEWVHFCISHRSNSYKSSE